MSTTAVNTKKKTTAAAPADAGVPETIVLERIKRQTVTIEVRGTAPLIVHSWSKKAREMMYIIQCGGKPAKVAKDALQDYLDSMYRFADEGHGMPTMAFKAATVGGARHYKNVTMTMLRGALRFLPDGRGVGNSENMMLTRLILPENFEKPIMREDMVRVGMGKADIRYRAEYPEWGALLRIEYIPAEITLGSIIALVDAGGMTGVGEWRPEKNGFHGTFEVIDTDETV